MENILTSFVDHLIPGERGKVLIEADAFLTNLGSYDHHHAIDAILAISDNIHQDDVVDSVYDTLAVSLETLIKDYGIGILEDQRRNIGSMLKILRGLQEIPGFEDGEGIVNITQEDDTPVEKLSQIVALTVGGDPHDYISCIQYVNPIVLDRIEETANQTVSYEPTVEENVTPIPTEAALSVFLEKPEHQHYKALFQKDGMRLGQPIRYYLDMLIHASEQTAYTIADHYIFASLASGMEVGDAMDDAADYLEAYIDDSRILQDTVRQVRRRIIEV